MFKLLIIAILIGISIALGHALISLMKGQRSETMVKTLGIRVGISLTLFILLIFAAYMGWIRPHGIYPSSLEMPDSGSRNGLAGKAPFRKNSQSYCEERERGQRVQLGCQEPTFPRNLGIYSSSLEMPVFAAHILTTLSFPQSESLDVGPCYTCDFPQSESSNLSASGLPKQAFPRNLSI